MRLLAGNDATADMFTWLMKLRKFVRYALIPELILSARLKIINFSSNTGKAVQSDSCTAFPVSRLISAPEPPLPGGYKQLPHLKC